MSAFFRIALALFALALVAGAQSRADPVYQSQTYACTHSAQASPSTATTTKLVSSAGGSNIYVCGFSASAAAAQTVTLVYGAAGGTCPSPQNVTPALSIGTLPLVDHEPFYSGLPVVPNGNDLCVVTTAATATAVIVYFAQF